MRSRLRKKPDDWFAPRNYPHFDRPVSDRSVAEGIVASFTKSPEQYRFLPLISFKRWARRWRTDEKSGRTRESWKKRPLAYCSNRDAHVLAYVGWELSAAYEEALKRAGLDNVVVGYRLGRSNVTTARDAFADVQRLGTCTTIALDLKHFFDTIRHRVLKRCWEDVLGSGLPPHHYAAFRAITRFALVDRGACLKRLGLPPRTQSRKLPRPLCSPDAFRAAVRGRKTASGGGGLVEVNQNAFGIPQGTPMSAIAANVAMFRFDCAVAAEAARVGGTYRRYSDDILLVCPPAAANSLLDFLRDALIRHCEGLTLNDDKTSRVEFPGGRLPANVKHMQYLGFLFNGERAVLRASTISRFYGRMRRAVKSAQHDLTNDKFQGSPKGGRPVLQRRKLMHSFSHLGRDSLLRTYAKVAGKVFQRRAIMRQLRRHLERLNSLTR
ncbi:hypothetical protein J5Y09_18180 [Roseomonas sp. PWR1]|uniref:Reverse transcriptase domain-containing protein n=1 Tax=Roseomonas nitratireducens TaxID=2820810 RepID=A0ABS4AWW7_9PROT|nr:reverse transcriptase domain-containing protein [Neoroseomonas nitratireducens]MBP0465860.1 hypothetical protein [Neoroseomonas nitratireducens]